MKIGAKNSGFEQTEIDRRLANVLAFGTVEEVDLEAATARVKIGDLLTGDLSMGFTRAGGDRDWHPYEVGEQVMVGCPSGDPASGVILCSINSDAMPPMQSSADIRAVDFGDGARVSYDRAAHHMTVNLGSGTASITASGGITIKGDITLTGKLTATGDVTADGVSLINHLHSNVAAGGAKSGKPVK